MPLSLGISAGFSVSCSGICMRQECLNCSPHNYIDKGTNTILTIWKHCTLFKHGHVQTDLHQKVISIDEHCVKSTNAFGRGRAFWSLSGRGCLRCLRFLSLVECYRSGHSVRRVWIYFLINSTSEQTQNIIFKNKNYSIWTGRISYRAYL